ncbi:MAG: DNA gyrase inhibitor YacG [Verrucomicrobia bacterium]|jgi:endogenous inhibitor of DNA gyrase (YacG/DUF329 family)|nr:DNA gyrase inhibitor YacG [Verrucomicrobiota bacterium]
MATSPVIKCPTCRKRGRWFDGPFGPFCSERCKLIDLGKWLGEEHRVSTPLTNAHLDQIEDLGPAQSPPPGLN